MQNIYTNPYLGLKLHNNESKEHQETARRENKAHEVRRIARMLRQPMAAEPMTGPTVFKQA